MSRWDAIFALAERGKRITTHTLARYEKNIVPRADMLHTLSELYGKKIEVFFISPRETKDG